MTPAHEQAARRLAALTGPERDWVLARLASDDALRIRDLLEPRPVPAEPEPPPPVLEVEAEPTTPQSMLEHAAAADVSRLLQAEPDWFIALILAQRRWSWDRELLAALHPARVEELSVLVWRAEGAKPRAREAAIERVAGKLRELAPAPAPAAAPSAFDELVGRMA
ncbi:MAG TPA: hypothetical protein VKE95_00695 [Burkholderiales bacterium]|nr:hypothetical protein [Burkholderiales bacterium]